LEIEAAKEGLKINEQKTKYMVAARNDGDKHFEVVKEFVYLRSLMTPTNDNCLYLEERFSKRYATRKSKMVSTGEGTTTNSINSLTARMP
jgi:hypothetical protein